MPTCVRPHCAIRSHNHEHELQGPELQHSESPQTNNCYEVHDHELQAPEFPKTSCTFAELLGYSQHFCDIALKTNYYDDKFLIDDYNFLFIGPDTNCSNCSTYSYKKFICTKILKPLMIKTDSSTVLDIKKLGILYIFSMLRTPIGQSVLKSHKLFNKTVNEKYKQFLDEAKYDLHFVEQLTKL
jgi:hypothetical protein